MVTAADVLSSLAIYRKSCDAYLDKLAESIAALGDSSTPDDPAPPPVVPPTPSADPFSRPLLTPDKLRYRGSALMPAMVGGFSTAYSPGCLTLVRGGQTPLFLSTVNWEPSRGDSAPFAFELPPTLAKDVANLSTVSIVQSWDSPTFYGGKKTVVPPSGPKEAVCHCLYFDPATGIVGWTFGPQYSDSASQVLPCVGATFVDFATGKVSQVLDPWRANINTQFTRGGVASIPPWLRPSLGGLDYVLGFGGYFSVYPGGSPLGPMLFAAQGVGENGVVQAKPLVNYQPNQRAWRQNDFYGVAGDATIAGPNDWTWCDELGGDVHASSFVFVDLPDYRGALFIPSLGTGKCWYQNKDVGGASYVEGYPDRQVVSFGRRIEWRVMDEANLVSGKLGATVLPFASPLGLQSAQRFGGLCIDNETRTLYAMECHAVPGRTLASDQVEPRHVIHAWEIAA